MNLSGFSKWGVGKFSRAVIFLLKIHPPHTQLALFVYTFGDFAMPLLSCAWLCNNSKWWLHLVTNPSSCTVQLFWCFLLKKNSMYYCINRWKHFQEKSTLCNNFIQKRRVHGLIFEGGPVFERLQYMHLLAIFLQFNQR